MIQAVTAHVYYRLFIAGEPLSQAIADGAAATAAAARGWCPRRAAGAVAGLTRRRVRH